MRVFIIWVARVFLCGCLY